MRSRTSERARSDPWARPEDASSAGVQVARAARWAWLFFLVAASASCAADRPPRGPYLQQMTSDAVVIAWRTSETSASRVLYGQDPMTLTRKAGSGKAETNHAVRVEGLEPATRYYYSVDRDLRSPSVHSFRTAPPRGAREPFRFWVVGDSGTGDRAERQVRDAMLAATRQRPIDFAIHVGDIAYPSGTEEEFDRGFFGPYAAILRVVPLWPALGNHEAESVDIAAQSGPWFDAFVLPTAGQAGGVPSHTEAYYAFDWGNAHFIMLDSSGSPRAKDGAMLRWLEADLAASEGAEWRIVVWHHAPYSTSLDGTQDDEGSVEMRENVVPIIERAGVDLVLAGHSHAYTRTFLIDGAGDDRIGDPRRFRLDQEPPSRGQVIRKRPGPNGGAIYVVAGHGGADADDVFARPTSAIVDNGHGSCIVDVDGDELRLVNVLATGAVGDSFSIVKRR